MNNLTSKAGLIAFGSGAAQIITILSTIVLARILSKGDLGTYKQTFLLYHIVAPIFIAGVPSSIFYFLPRLKKEEDKKMFVVRSISLLVTLGLLLGLFVSLSSFWAPKIMHNDKLGPLLVVFGFYAFAGITEGFFQPVLVIYNKLKMLLLYL